MIATAWWPRWGRRITITIVINTLIVIMNIIQKYNTKSYTTYYELSAGPTGAPRLLREYAKPLRFRIGTLARCPS